jgi:hypothetical protein
MSTLTPQSGSRRTSLVACFLGWMDVGTGDGGSGSRGNVRRMTCSWGGDSLFFTSDPVWGRAGVGARCRGIRSETRAGRREHVRRTPSVALRGIGTPQTRGDEGRRRRNNSAGVPSASLVTGSWVGSHLLDQDVGRVTGLIGAEEAGHHPPRARHRATLRRLAPVAVVPAERHGACAQQRRSSSLWRLFASCGDFIEDSAVRLPNRAHFLGLSTVQRNRCYQKAFQPKKMDSDVSSPPARSR